MRASWRVSCAGSRLFAAASRICSIFSRCLSLIAVIGIETPMMMPMIGIRNARSPISIVPLWQQRSAQAFDLGRQARVAGHVVSLGLGQPAVDVAEAGADLASGARRALAHALPVVLLLL